MHRATPELERLRSRALRVRVLDPDVSPGERGAVVRLLQRGLQTLHYAVPRSGVYDPATQRAVMAWRKMTGQARTYDALLRRWCAACSPGAAASACAIPATATTSRPTSRARCWR